MVDTCYFCKEPLGGTYTFYWDNRCHYRCLPETPDQKIINNQRDRIAALEAQLAERVKVKPLDPDMPAQQLRMHLGEMTAQEMRTARAAIRLANSTLSALEVTTPAPKVTVQQAAQALYDAFPDAMGLPREAYRHAAAGNFFTALLMLAQPPALTAAQEAGKP